VTEKTKEENSFNNDLIDWIKHIAIAVVIAILIVNFLLQRTIVQKYSMEPTLYENDSLLVEKITPRLHIYKHGNIITINMSENGNYKTIIKRVIGLPGDHIEIKDGKVYVNEKVLEENYINGDFTKKGSYSKYNDIIVPDEQLYVLGDNRIAAIIDSRTEGTIPFKDVQGKAFIRIYPFDNFGFLK